MTTAVDNFAALERTLNALPPPPAGHVRVYRGQTNNFPAMLPSSCRPHAPYVGRLWEMALLHVRQAAFAADPAAAPDTTADALRVMMNMVVWFKVLAQHYGPGSPYLDVTTAPEVALWFALNENQPAGVLDKFVVSQPGLGSTRLVCPTLKFSPRAAGGGWFYVLDVPRSEGERAPEHGELLELEAGPEFVSTCLRVVRQHGGLVLGDHKVSGGDLARFYACPPIPVTRPFDGCPFIDRDARYLFPGPDDDTWYARLLQAPLMLQPSESGCEYRQSLGVYLVMAADDETGVSLLDRQLARMPPLARAELRTMPEARRDLRAACGVDPEAATYVQVEIPLLAGLPAPAAWNQALLRGGLSKRTRPFVESTTEALPAVSLESVLIQLSPLESALLDARADAQILRALWVVRRGERFQVTMFMGPQDQSARDAAPPAIIGPLEIEFSPSDHGFVVKLGNERPRLLDAGIPDLFVKVFFVALDILRGLSGSLKPDPYLMLTIDSDRVLPLRRDALVLTRPRADPADLRLHFLRNADSREPYMGPGLEMPSAGYLVLQLAEEFAALRTLQDVYGSARKLVLDGVAIDLPVPETSGVSPAVAAFVMKVIEGQSA